MVTIGLFANKRLGGGEGLVFVLQLQLAHFTRMSSALLYPSLESIESS